MSRVSVEGLKFFAFHGCHPLESKTGGEFEVDIHVDTSFDVEVASDKIDDAVDYVMLMEVASEQMKIRCNLIEKVAYNIGFEIQRRIKRPHKLTVKVHKLNAPVIYDLKQVSVSIDMDSGMNK
jgi:dihydroneopterin aldolase